MWSFVFTNGFKTSIVMNSFELHKDLARRASNE